MKIFIIKENNYQLYSKKGPPRIKIFFFWEKTVMRTFSPDSGPEEQMWDLDTAVVLTKQPFDPDRKKHTWTSKVFTDVYGEFWILIVSE